MNRVQTNIPFIAKLYVSIAFLVLAVIFRSEWDSIATAIGAFIFGWLLILASLHILVFAYEVMRSLIRKQPIRWWFLGDRDED